MPSLSLWKTLDASDFKRRGVEKLIAKNLGSSSPATAAFAKNTKKKIEKESMMYKRSKPVRKVKDEDRNGRDVPRAKPVPKAKDEDRNGRDVPRAKPVRKAKDEDRNVLDVPRAKPIRKAKDEERNGRDVPRGLKTMPSMAEDETREGIQDYTLSDLSGYDDDSSVASIDWTLPGVDQNVDIRYEYIDTDYYAPELRQKRKEKVQKEGLQRMRSTDTMEMIAKGSSCLCYGEWPRCI